MFWRNIKISIFFRFLDEAYPEYFKNNFSSYNFNENMQDPFGSKKPTVMNTPPKSDPFASMPQPTGKANFHDELADQSRAQVEQPEAGA